MFFQTSHPNSCTRKLLPATNLLMTLLVVALVVVTHTPDAKPPSATSRIIQLVESDDDVTSSSIRLNILQGTVGGEAVATLSFDAAITIRSFNVLLQFEPNELLAASRADFQRNPTFFHDISLGDYSLNDSRDAGPGRIRIIGLAPATTAGSAEIGYLRLHISPNASIGATQTITLTGEISYADTGVVTIEPVVAVVRVVEMTNDVFLPIIMQSK